MTTAHQRFLDHFPDARQQGDGWLARCPAHDDHEPSLSIGQGRDGRVLIKCHAGCTAQQIVDALGLQLRDLFEPRAGRESPSRHSTHRRRGKAGRTTANGSPPSPPSPSLSGGPPSPPEEEASPGLTLAEYAQAKRLPLAFLKQELGLYQRRLHGEMAVCMPYCDLDGTEVSSRYRLALTGGRRFRWRSRDKVMPYGLERLQRARATGYVILVEGESDAQTLWHHNLPALGLPGANTWRDGWADYVQGLEVFVWQEPDAGGTALLKRIVRSLPEARVLQPPPGLKDISQHHVAGGDVASLVAALRAQAPTVAKRLAAGDRVDAAAERAMADELPTRPDLLDRFIDVCRCYGLVGEERNAKILYLALTSRLRKRPVNICVRGASSSGKSFLVDTVLKPFPPRAFDFLTAMSDKALLYYDEPLSHRVLVFAEAAGLNGEIANLAVRSLLSEGRLNYMTVDRTELGLQSRRLTREGPTGLILTTTRIRLDAELSSRLFHISTVEGPEQTERVMDRRNRRANDEEWQEPDLEPWHALQRWLAAGECRVKMPFMDFIASQMGSRMDRMRRYNDAVRGLVASHALLHRAQRARTAKGWILATLADYEAVYDLVADIVAEEVRALVPQGMRDTVEVVRRLLLEKGGPVSRTQVARAMDVHPSSALRRLNAATEEGYLKRVGTYNSRWGQGEALPQTRVVLPPPAELAAAMEGRAADRSPAAEDDPVDGGDPSDTRDSDPGPLAESGPDQGSLDGQEMAQMCIDSGGLGHTRAPFANSEGERGDECGGGEVDRGRDRDREEEEEEERDRYREGREESETGEGVDVDSEVGNEERNERGTRDGGERVGSADQNRACVSLPPETHAHLHHRDGPYPVALSFPAGTTLPLPRGRRRRLPSGRIEAVFRCRAELTAALGLVGRPGIGRKPRPPPR